MAYIGSGDASQPAATAPYRTRLTDDAPRDPAAAKPPLRCHRKAVTEEHAEPSEDPSEHVPWVVLLVATTAVVYFRVVGYDFVAYDDDLYVFANSQVTSGLDAESASWAFRQPHIGHYHPLTWLSHMLDVTLFELDAGGHHATSLAIHAANTLLLYAFFARTTGSAARAAMVAALFALHPLSVEPVAWIASRKDVLSMLFVGLALLLYARHAERPSAARLAWVALFYVLGLLTKSMVIMLPVVLLFLDYWPLRRWRRDGDAGWGSARGVVVEKVPLFLIAIGAVGLMLYSASLIGVMNARGTPLLGRLSTSVANYGEYLLMLSWPLDLAVHYPLPDETPGVGVTLVWLASLLLVSGLVWRFRRGREYLVAGWGIFLVTLLPVVGLLELGAHVRADRYMYLPAVGIFVLGVWLVGDQLLKLERGRLFSIAVGGATVLTLVVLSFTQVTHWRDSETLFRHAVAVAPESPRMHNLLGRELANRGEMRGAVHHLTTAVRLRPDYVKPRNNLAVILWRSGRVDEAIGAYREILAIDPDYASAHANLALALRSQSSSAEAEKHYRRAIELEAEYVNAHVGLGELLLETGRVPEARRQLERALELSPDHAGARKALNAANSARTDDG